MDEKEILLKDLELQWQDHFHMRDQTWKTLQYTIFLFIGVVGLEIKGDIEPIISLLAYTAVLITSALGFIVALHHRQRQKEKFEIIIIYETELGILDRIKPVLDKSKVGFVGKVNTSTYIVAAQLGLFSISAALLTKLIIS